MRKYSLYLTILILAWSGQVIAQDSDSGDHTQDLPSPLQVNSKQQSNALPSPNQVNAQQRKEQIAATLFRELDNLIPGQFEDDSPQKLAIEKVIQLFQDGKATEATKILDELAASDENFPPKELLLAGVTYAANDPARGRLLLENAAIKYPDYPGVFLAFARLAVNENRIADARAQMEKSARLVGKDKFPEVVANHFKEIYFDGMIDVSLRQQSNEEARNLAGQLKALNPENNKYLLAMAELEFRDKKLDSSLDFLNQLKTRVPQARTPELVIATWFQQQGDEENTRKWAQSAADKYPNDPMVQVEFANYAIAGEDFPAAHTAIKQAENELGEQPGTINLKAKIAFAQGTYALAETHYKQLFEMQPNNFDWSNMYALSLAESSDETKLNLARQIAQRNYQQLPNNQIAQAAMGWVLFKQGNKADARKLLQTAVASPAPEIRYYVASILHDAGETERARLLLEPALESKGFFLYRSAAKELMESFPGTP